MSDFNKVKTRKAHTCKTCGEKIPKGSQAYSKSVKKYRGGWDYLIHHTECYRGKGGKITDRRYRPEVEEPAWFDGGHE